MEKIVETDIEGFDLTGPGIGTDGKRAVLVWGALPGERVKAVVRKRRKRMLHALVQDVLDPSPDRVPPLEDHYLSCSPWQVLAPERELWHKRSLAQNELERAGVELPDLLDIACGTQSIGYRNKMEFSFTSLEAGEAGGQDKGLALALFKRLGRWKNPLTGCALASRGINTAALHILEELKRVGTPERSLKTLMLRSDRRGRVLAALFLKDEDAAPRASALMGGPLQGMQVWFSEPRTMASRPTKLLSQVGSDVFEETLSPFEGSSSVTLRSGLLGFFQINPEVFEMVIRDMAPYL
ncbi:MAG TPA: hypothetical protein ENI12_03445, partial [Nitrospirae bacterium]|nr:hypothetical protein [Nitrospirota bacterium]